ncbi:hypothetical protein [Geodermatophilus sp. URMC 62]|uniref:hypothetical protein n=1 Tax=Geodermatophilus sp. URMC 62 TaxID=3423414 RepID=UPI00406C0AD5
MIPNPDRLVKVGPLSPVNGYPLWYKDSRGTRLELVTEPDDPFAPAVGEPESPQGTPRPGFPSSFPEEAFYMLAEAHMVTGGQARPGRARVVLALEAAFGGTGVVMDGQQVVFGRIRFRIDGAIPGALYTFTHPYGQSDPLPADDRGRVFVTEDIGVTPLAFDGALQSSVAPFLRWTTGADMAPGEAEAPPGYVGDGVTEHTVTGSPVQGPDGQPLNYVRIEGPNIADAGGPRDPADPTNPDKVFTPLFVLQGRLARTTGVEITRAVYARDAAGAVSVDVFADSEPGQAITVGVPGQASVPMDASQENYYARLASGDGVPQEVTVTNTSDAPPWVRTTGLSDAVLITQAEYDSQADTLTVIARSSDQADPPTLTVRGQGLAPASPGTQPGITAPPTAVTVDSSHGGSGTETVTATN